MLALSEQVPYALSFVIYQQTMHKRISSFLLTLLIYSVGLSAQGQLPRGLFSSINKTSMERWADSLYRSMDDEEKLAQLIMPIIYPSADAQRIQAEEARVKKHRWGGILYQRGQLAEQNTMNARLQRASRVPMLIALDGEWGLYMRLKDAPRYPRNLGLGMHGDEQLLYNYGREVARQCALMGIHVNFAPTIDVNINPRNPVIGSRSFGEDPKVVARMSLAYAQGLEDGGVLSVAKHFPGHGDTSEDSHKTLPLVSADKARMQRVELYPFSQYIRGGFGGIMTAHLRVPAYEPSGIPSSLSHKITTELLQHNLGFGGLIFTDGLEMQGVQTNKLGDIGVAALKAGNDILLGPRSAEQQLKALLQAKQSGELSEELIRHKVMKLLRYKWRLIVQQPQRTASPERIHSEIWTEPATREMRKLWQASLIYYQRTERTEQALKAGQYKRIAVVQVGKNPIANPPRPTRGLGGSTITYLSWGGDATRTAQLASYDLILVNAFDTQVPREALVSLASQRPVLLAHYATPYKVRPDSWHKGLSHVLLTTEAAREAQEAVLSLLTQEQAKATPLPSAPLSDDSDDPTANMTPRTPAPSSASSKPRAQESLLRFDEGRFDALEAIIEEGLKSKAFPGCQVYIAHKGQTIYHKAFGLMGMQVERQQVERSTLYDVASITKALATTPAVMLLVGDGKLKLHERLQSYLPEFAGSDIGRASLRSLLLHQTGLPAGLNFFTDLIDSTSYAGELISPQARTGYIPLVGRAWGNPRFDWLRQYISPKQSAEHPLTMARGLFISPEFKAVMLARLKATPLKRAGQYRYTDLGFILLQQVVERISGQSLDEFLQRRLFAPIGAKVYFNPLQHGVAQAEIAPSQVDRFLRKQTIQGTVDDESAACLGGVSGNAGLFASASELAKIAQLLLNQGRWEGKQIIPSEVVRQFMSDTDMRGRRALGFDKPQPRSAYNGAGESASAGTVGHFGFTGTAFWIDPKEQLLFIFLSNRTYPTRSNNHLSTERYRPRLHQAVYEAL